MTVEPTAAKDPVEGAVSVTVGDAPVALTTFRVPVAESIKVTPSVSVARAKTL